MCIINFKYLVTAACILGLSPLSCLAQELWTPSHRDPTLTAWWDAADTGTISQASGKVTAITDKSENGYTMLQGTDASRPLTGSTNINSLNALYFDGSDDWLEAGNVAVVNGDLLVSMVAIPLEGGTWSSLISTAASSNSWSVRGANSGIFFGTLTANDLGGEIGIGGGNRNFDTNVWSITFDYTGAGTFGGHIDGSATASTSYTAPMASSSTFQLGKAGSSSLNCVMAEVVLSSDMSDENRQKLEGYLAWKWGLEAELAALHPYKNEPPYAPPPSGTVISVK